MLTDRRVARQNRALAAALEDGLCTRVEQFTATDWVVPSTTTRHRQYIVVADGGTYRCNCRAGAQGQPCQHAAAVYRVRRGLVRSRVTVNVPTTPAAVAAAPVRQAALSASRPSGRGVGLGGDTVDEEDGVSAILAALRTA